MSQPATATLVQAANEVAVARCRWCRRPLPNRAAKGRPRLYCRRSCRQRRYEADLRARELGLSEAELVVARHGLDTLYDAIFVLEAAIQDVDGDLRLDDSPGAVREALDWLLAAARDVVASDRP
jgi:hypothetical protein